jgi:hypothetical protein
MDFFLPNSKKKLAYLPMIALALLGNKKAT